MSKVGSAVAASLAGIFSIAINGASLAGTGPDATGVAIAFVHVRSGGSVARFGGSGTTSASVSHPQPGTYDVTFKGKYPKMAPGNLIINTTAQSDNFEVTNAIVQSASKSQIAIRVLSWESDNLKPLDDDVYLTVFFGR